MWPITQGYRQNQVYPISLFFIFCAFLNFNDLQLEVKGSGCLCTWRDISVRNYLEILDKA